jgi:hypothetical protein
LHFAGRTVISRHYVEAQIGRKDGHLP